MTYDRIQIPETSRRFPRRRGAALFAALAFLLALSTPRQDALAQEPAASPSADATPAATPVPAIPTPSVTPGLPRDLFLLPETMPSPIPMEQLSTETLKLRMDKASELIASTDAVATPEGAARLGVPQQRLRDRVERLRDWHAQLSRQISALEKTRAAAEAEQAASKAVEEFRLSGFPAPRRTRSRCSSRC
jgi:hypothetical protein